MSAVLLKTPSVANCAQMGLSNITCSATYEVSGSWIPDFTCQDCASGTEVECKPSGNATSSTEMFSGLDPIVN